MARKDVDLIIRAKDESVNVLDAITDAINDFVSAQGKLGKTGKNTATVLTELGRAASDLQKEIGNVSLGAKLAEEMDKASKASQRLQDEFAETTKHSDRLNQQLREAGVAAETFAKKSDGAARAQERQTKTLKEAQATQKSLNTELAKATTDKDKAVAKELKLQTAMEKTATAVEAQRARVAQLSAAYDAAEKPTATMGKTLASAQGQLEKLETKFSGLQQEAQETGASVARLGGEITRLSGEVGKANADVSKQETILNKIGTNYDALGKKAAAAAKQETLLSTAVDRQQNALARSAAAVDKAETELTNFAAAAGKANASMGQLAAASTATLTKAFDAQRRAMLETNREWTKAEATAKTLGTAIGQVGVPTRQMAEGFVKARSEAARLKQEYIAQRDGLHQMSAALKTSVTDLTSLQNRQNAFAGAQATTGRAILTIRAAAKEAAASYNLLSGNANRAGIEIRNINGTMSGVAGNTDRAARSTNSLAEAYRKMYGESRQAMSYTQRLRGELLSLITAYGGFQGAISLLQNVVKQYQTLEAAQSRLNVAFQKGGPQAVSNEMDFLRRNANRLGIEFGTLAQEYSKFAVATQGTSLEGEKTRKIFLSVAEAARVNKSSNEELQGVFVALTQIVSKGAVQMEELRQQLGDRLPGALQIMASGLKVSTAELIKMMEQGEVTAEALVPFAEELDRRFGPGLAKSLETTTTAMGQFWNAAQQAMLVFANAGFIQSFTNLLKDMTATLKSDEFLSFAKRASAALGIVLDVIGTLVTNFDKLIIAASLFAGVKLVPFALAVGAGFANLGTTLTRVGRIMGATQSTMVATSGAMATTGVAVRGLTLAFRTLLSATGVGLALTAVSVAIGYWASSADNATEAFNRHRDIMDKVRNAYDAAGGATEKFFKSLESLSLSQAQENLDGLRKQLKSIKDETVSYIDTFASLQARRSAFNIFSGTKGAQDQYNEIQRLNKEFSAGTLEIDKYKEALNQIAQNAATEEMRTYANELQGVADRASEAARQVGEAEKVVKIKSGTDKDAADAAKQLSGAADDNVGAQNKAAEASAKWKSELDKMNEIIPEIGENLDRMKLKANLDEAFQSAARAATTMGELNKAVADYNTQLGRLNTMAPNFEAEYSQQRFAGGTQGKNNEVLVREVSRLAEKMGLAAKDLLAAMSFETGGSLDPSKMGGTGGKYLGLIQFSPDNQRKYGLDQSSSIEKQVAAAGDYLEKAGVKAGDGLVQIYAAILSGSAKNVNASDVKNGGVVSNVTSAVEGQQFAGHIKRAEGLLAAYNGVSKAAEETYKTEVKSNEERIKQQEATKQNLADNEQEIANQKLVNDGKQREAAINKAIYEEKKRNPNVSDADLAKLREQEGILYDLKNVKTEDKNQQKEANALMAQVNALLQQRTALESQLKAAQASGDTTKVQETQTQLTQVNSKLDETIAKAKEMWQSIGGTAADTALTKLDTASIKAQNLAQQARTNYIDWTRVGNLFASGLTNAFDQFAQAVANGEDVGEAAKNAFLQFAADFLRQIAQMIIQQAILNALRSFSPSLFGGVGAAHSGGIIGSMRAGSGNQTRRVDPGIFLGATRFHTGGFPGLAPDEVPIIAQKGEEMLSKDDPRNALNGGMDPSATNGGQPQDIKVINTFDAASFISEGLNSKSGQRAFLNFVSANPRAFKQALGS